MRILITGCCGFVGSTLAHGLLSDGHEIVGLDNFSRPGSEINRAPLEQAGVSLHVGDAGCATDVEALPPVDYVIEAAANPSVLAGLDGHSPSKRLLEDNLFSTIHTLEYCKRHGSGLILLSTSRVYSIAALNQIPLRVAEEALVFDGTQPRPSGVTATGIDETFSTQPPLSLYGTSKYSSELLAMEYGSAFGFPVWVNRCGVLAGPGQFGRPDQGIVSFWLHAWRAGKPLRYIGYGGSGHQVRDILHVQDLLCLVRLQLAAPAPSEPRLMNVSGGKERAVSLAQLSAWCADRFGAREVGREAEQRHFDLPWVVLDSTQAVEQLAWRPKVSLSQTLTEIADFAEAHPDWLALSAGA